MGFVDEDGFVHYVGRIKRSYLTKVIDGDGTLYKIFPQRIEECIEQLDEVNICGVIIRKDDARLHIPEAYVVLPGKNTKEKNVIEKIWTAVKEEMPEHSWPESIHVIDAMPMTPSGKIDYRALEQLTRDIS